MAESWKLGKHLPRVSGDQQKSRGHDLCPTDVSRESLWRQAKNAGSSQDDGSIPDVVCQAACKVETLRGRILNLY